MVFEEFWIYAKGIKIKLRKEGALLYYDLWVKIKNWLVLLAWCDLCGWKWMVLIELKHILLDGFKCVLEVQLVGNLWVLCYWSCCFVNVHVVMVWFYCCKYWIIMWGSWSGMKLSITCECVCSKLKNLKVD